MLTYEEAIARILDQTAPGTPARLPLRQLRGLVLAEDVTAPLTLPPFANSSMDGYAVRAEDLRAAATAGPVHLPLAGEVAAGAAAPAALAPHTAVRILTGAPLPPGADTVVPQEDVTVDGDAVLFTMVPAAGQCVRPAGEDVALGTTVLSAGSLLRPAEVAMLAAVGRTDALVCPRPRVAIVGTGDELVEPGGALRPGQIYNSNTWGLAAQVEEAGGVIVALEQAGDTPEAIRAAFDRCAGADVLLSSGGVSVGDHDHVKSVFAERGAVDFWQVAIRPGKPLAFGRWNDTLFFGLPGNPVSALVTCELFVRPALRKWLGHADLFRPMVQARLLEEASHGTGRRSYQRAIVTRDPDGYFVRATSQQGSGMLRSMVGANGLLILPHDVLTLPAGEFASVLLLDN